MKILVSLLLLIFLFTPRISFGGFVVPSVAFLYVLGLINLRFAISNKFIFHFFIILCVIQAYFLLIQIIGGLNVSLILFQPFLLILLVSAFSFIFAISKKADLCIISLSFYLISFNALIIIICFFSEPFRVFFHEVFILTDKAYRSTFGETLSYRFSGFTTSGFTNLSLLHALIYGFWAKLYVTTKKVKLFPFLFLSLINIFALIFVARTGLYLFLIIFFGVLVYYFLTTRRIAEFSGNFVLLIVPVVFAFNYIELENFEVYIEFAFNMIIELIVNNEVSDSAAVLVNDMYFLPDSELTTIIGNGNLGRGAYYIDSDVGFVLLINAFGILGTILIFSPFLFIVLMSILNKNQLILTTLCLFFLAVMNFKDLYLFSHSYIQALIIIMYYEINKSSIWALNSNIREIVNRTEKI